MAKAQPEYPEFKLEKEGLVVYHLRPSRDTVSVFSAKKPYGGNTDWYLSLNGGNGTSAKVERKDEGFVISISQLPLKLQEEVMKKESGLLLPAGAGIYRIQL